MGEARRVQDLVERRVLLIFAGFGDFCIKQTESLTVKPFGVSKDRTKDDPKFQIPLRPAPFADISDSEISREAT